MINMKKILPKLLNYDYIIDNIVERLLNEENNRYKLKKEENVSISINKDINFLNDVNLKRNKLVNFDADLKLMGVDINSDTLNYVYTFLENYKKIDIYITRNINEKNYEKYLPLIDFYITILKKISSFKVTSVNVGEDYNSEIHISYSEKNVKEYKIIKEIMPAIEKEGKLIKAKVLLK